MPKQHEKFTQEEDEDEFISGFDCFELNFNMNEAILSVQSLREFSRNISYISGHDDDGISPDCWSMVFEYLPFVEFYKCSLICSAFAEIITFNGRYLIMKKSLNDFGRFLKATPTSFQQVVNMLSERSPMSEKYSWENELLNFYLGKRRVKDGLWEYWNDSLMNEELIIEQFRRMNKKNVDNYFGLFSKIPDRLKRDKEFIVKLLKSSNYAASFYIHLDHELKTDKEIMMIAVNGNGFMLKYMSDHSLPIDEEIARAAIKAKFRKSMDYQSSSPGNFHSYQYYSLLPFTRDLIEITPELVQNEFLRTIEKKAKVNIARHIITAYCDRLDVLQWILSISFFLTRDCDLCLSIIEFIYNIEKGKPVGVNSPIKHDVLNGEYSFFKVFDSEIPEWLTRKVQICPQFRLHRKEFTILDMAKKLTFRSSIIFWKLLETKITNNLLDFIKSITLEVGVSPSLAHQIHTNYFIKKCIDKEYGQKVVKSILSDRACVKKLLGMYPLLHEKITLFKEDPVIKNLSDRLISRIELPLSDEKLIYYYTSNPYCFMQFFKKKRKWDELETRLQRLLFIHGEDANLKISPQLLERSNPLAVISHIVGNHYEIWSSITDEEWLVIMTKSKTRSFIYHVNNIPLFANFLSICKKIEPIAESLNNHQILKNIRYAIRYH